MLSHYIKIAVRNLLKYKTQNIISIIGLAVCFLCFSVCIYCSRFFLSVNQCFEKYDRIAEIILQTPDGSEFSGTPATLSEQLQKIQANEIEKVTFLTFSRSRSYNIEVEEGKEFPFEEIEAIETDANFYDVFTPKVIAGSWNVAAQTPNAVIMTASMARKAFGEEGDAIGKRMVLTQRLFSSPDTTPRTGGIAYTIQAIIEDIPQNNSLNFCSNIDILVLNDSEGLLLSSVRESMTGGSTCVLLQEGKSVQQLENSFRKMNLTNNLFQQDNAVCAIPLGKNQNNSAVQQYFVYITVTLGVLILLIGLLNFFHFLTGSFLNRSREYSLRKVLGSDSRELFSLLFVQSVLVILIAFLFNFCLIELLAPYFHFTLMRYSLSIDKFLLMRQCSEYLILVFILNSLICALTVFFIRRISIQQGIKGINKYAGKHRMRNTMLGVQFFICWIFVVLTAALYLQAEKTTTTLFGTLSKNEKECILSVELDYRFMKNNEKLTLIERMAQHSGVLDKLPSDVAYTQGMSGTGLQTEKGNSQSGLDINVMRATSNFFQFMNIPILKGRTLENSTEMVVDETLEKRLNKDILGITLYNFNDGYTTTGVSSPFVASVYDQSVGFAFLPSNFHDYVGHCYLKCAPSQLQEVKKHVFKVLKEELPYTLSPKVTTLQEDIEEQQAIESKMKNIILFFAIVSIIITLLGVFSAITLDTERRKKEVAIRKVNGAGLRQIFLLFIRTYICMLIMSAVLAFPILYMLLKQWSRMYTVFFNDGVCFWGGVFIGITLILVLTVIFRILKIARINPAEAIKTE